MNWFSRLFSNFSILRLKPDDVIVLKLEEYVSPSNLETLYGEMKRLFPDHRVAVLPKGTDFEVVRSRGSYETEEFRKKPIDL